MKQLQKMKQKFCCMLLAISFFAHGFAQLNKADSIRRLLDIEKQETNKVTLLCDMAQVYNAFKPDTALALAQQALYLAQKIKFTDGESRALGYMGNAFNQIGNYPKALEYYLLKLQLEEKRKNAQNLANVLLNIGVVYLYQEEFDKALVQYYLADSILNAHPKEGDRKFDLVLRWSVALNIGDVYVHIQKPDSAFIYFTKSLAIAKEQQSGDFTGTSLVGIAEVYLKQKNYALADYNFKAALPYLIKADNEDVICEVYIGLAQLFSELNKNDSARHFAGIAIAIAQKDKFLAWNLKAVAFLNEHYKKLNKMDSAYFYLKLSNELKDSISSKNRIRESQLISSNEQIRQRELAEQKLIAKKERFQQLQLLFIGIFIPAFFLLTLILSRRKIHARVIRFLGIISLLILFEYLTLLLHPYVLEITNHTPIYELIIFVAIAAILIRAHHRIEQWFIEKLINRNIRLGSFRFPIRHLKTKKIKNPPANI